LRDDVRDCGDRVAYRALPGPVLCPRCAGQIEPVILAHFMTLPGFGPVLVARWKAGRLTRWLTRVLSGGVAGSRCPAIRPTKSGRYCRAPRGMPWPALPGTYPVLVARSSRRRGPMSLMLGVAGLLPGLRWALDNIGRGKGAVFDNCRGWAPTLVARRSSRFHRRLSGRLELPWLSLALVVRLSRMAARETRRPRRCRVSLRPSLRDLSGRQRRRWR
jgi:hypothetical protein